MIRGIAIVLIVCACTLVRAQERVPRETCLKAACQLSLDLKQLLDTPIPTDPDIKRVVAVARDEHAGLVLPETRLTAETISKAGTEPTAVAQIWLHKVIPMRDGQPVAIDELKMVRVGPVDNPRTVARCVVAVCRSADGKPQLLILSKDKKPLLTLPVRENPTAGPGDDPIDIAAAAENETGVVTLTIAGRYEASFHVAPTE